MAAILMHPLCYDFEKACKFVQVWGGNYQKSLFWAEIVNFLLFGARPVTPR